ncbi:MAG: hypothetical protein JO011_05430 [Ktedonobacteraceae bacterium]|nr:hypothetical protein [Ktedonobacteraceae bacterium]
MSLQEITMQMAKGNSQSGKLKVCVSRSRFLSACGASQEMVCGVRQEAALWPLPA